MNDIKVIFEDESILILDKPAGITVNRSDTTKDDYTLADFVEKKLNLSKDRKNNGDPDFYEREGIVHRIDKETSGILIVAKTLAAFKELQRQFKERGVQKTYIALSHGDVVADEGEIIVPVGRLPWNRKRFGVLAGGKEAITKYKVIERIKKQYTLLELNPKTGRTHQIRVHLKYFNHPIFADPLYGGRKTARDDRKILERVFLHAHKISFTHPVTKKTVSFESPLPLELARALEYLKH